MLLDSDSEGNRVKPSLEQKYSPPNEWFKRIVQVTDPEYADSYFGTAEGDDVVDHELEDLFGAELFAKMVNSVFGPRLTDGEPFELDNSTVPSMSKKKAQAWLDSTGVFSKDDIYQVPERFSKLAQESTIHISDDVRDRFAVLLDELTLATEQGA